MIEEDNELGKVLDADFGANFLEFFLIL